MKKIGKIILAIIILLSSIISNFIGVGTKVEATTFFVDATELKARTTISGTITYNGEEIYTTYVYYIKNGVEYPAYCISPSLDGVGEYGSYTVTVDSVVNDSAIWRVVTNGYPYKSVAELGCYSVEEAFVATKHALYCMMLGRDPSWYGSLGTRGDRVKNAMTQIFNAANSSSAGKTTGSIDIIERNDDWIVDNSNSISKTFGLSTSAGYNTYNVSLEGNYPEGTTILDTNNSPKTTFSSGEDFKIIIPMGMLQTNGNFRIKVSTRLKTKPVLYGRAPSGTGLQDYALTASIFEDAEGYKTVNYSKNATKLEIIKKDDKTLKPLKGVEFRVLDQNKKPVYTDLITDAQGKAIVTGLQPGKYYLEEVKTLDGYVKYDKLIEFEIDYNQELTITVNNTLEKNKETSTSTKNISVVQNKEKMVVNNSEENITKIDNEENTEIHNVAKETTENNEIKTRTESNIIENTNRNSTDIKKLGSLSIENENKNNLIEKIKTFIGNENININKNLIEQFLKIDNKNSNLNENLQKILLDILNENDNENLNVQNEDNNIANSNNEQNYNNQKVNTDIHTKINNENVRGNINQNINTNVQTSNINANSQHNEVIKLPKTGM